MPGNQVKNWAMYEDLRQKGMSKESAARITNAKYSNKPKRKRGKGKRKATPGQRRVQFKRKFKRPPTQVG